MGEMVAHGAEREDTAYRNGTRVSARDHSRLSGVQYGRILVAATVETDFSGLCPDSLMQSSIYPTGRWWLPSGFVFVLMVIAFLDRINIGFAA